MPHLPSPERPRGLGIPLRNSVLFLCPFLFLYMGCRGTFSFSLPLSLEPPQVPVDNFHFPVLRPRGLDGFGGEQPLGLPSEVARHMRGVEGATPVRHNRKLGNANGDVVGRRSSYALRAAERQVE